MHGWFVSYCLPGVVVVAVAPSPKLQAAEAKAIRSRTCCPTTLTVRNEGSAPLPFAPDALVVDLETSDAIEELGAGDFDRVAKSDERVSLLRTRTFRAVRCALDPGETATLGPIRTTANHLRARVAGQVVEIDLK